MRSTLIQLCLVALPLALASGVVIACGGADSLNTFRAGNSNEVPTSGGESTRFNPADASYDEKSAAAGSPLCGIVAGQSQCLPDDDGQTSLAYGVKPCAEDAGPPNVDNEDGGRGGTPACRLVAKEGDISPTCNTDNADPRGVDGVSCSKGSDCAPGFDCVEGEKGPVCRRYCCSGSCEQQSSRSGGPTFCDIQRLIDFKSHNAPVCMPVKTCALLRDGDCSDEETCAVVNEKGDTGCVTKGPVRAGESCEADHCASDLTCLGSPGDRRCYKLCRVDGSDCGPMQTCSTGAVFQDTTFGVCQDD